MMTMLNPRVNEQADIKVAKGVAYKKKGALFYVIHHITTVLSIFHIS